jgi:hypothetical protein
MAFDGEKYVKDLFDKAFKEELTPSQIIAICKLCKRVRRYARNNAAFNNLMNRMITYATFRDVTMTKRNGEKYPGLQVTMKDGTKHEDEQEDEE